MRPAAATATPPAARPLTKVRRDGARLSREDMSNVDIGSLSTNDSASRRRPVVRTLGHASRRRPAAHQTQVRACHYPSRAQALRLVELRASPSTQERGSTGYRASERIDPQHGEKAPPAGGDGAPAAAGAARGRGGPGSATRGARCPTRPAKAPGRAGSARCADAITVGCSHRWTGDASRTGRGRGRGRHGGDGDCLAGCRVVTGRRRMRCRNARRQLDGGGAGCSGPPAGTPGHTARAPRAARA